MTRTHWACLIAGFILGAFTGLWAAVVQTAGSLDAYVCTEYSPVTGKCVVFTNIKEQRRYD